VTILAKLIGGLKLPYRVARHLHPGSRLLAMIRRVAVGAWNDGTIHAGNLAYMSLLAIFPFFIVGAAIFQLVGEASERAGIIRTVMQALPREVANVLEPVALDVIELRTGWLLWAGAAVGLWTMGSLVETIRDILHRAYRTPPALSFWHYRLLSTGIIIAAVVLLMLSLIAQVVIGTAEEVILARFPHLAPDLTGMLSNLALSRLLTGIGLFGSIYLLFFTLTPEAYRLRRYPKWPGALVVTVWWAGVTLALPPLLRSIFTYSLTYGSLAGIMIALFFFWLVGLGMVVGAELNAALASAPDAEQDRAMIVQEKE
jgi:membrane protein